MVGALGYMYFVLFFLPVRQQVEGQAVNGTGTTRSESRTRTTGDRRSPTQGCSWAQLAAPCSLTG